MPFKCDLQRYSVVITSSSIHSPENPDGRAGTPASLGSLAGVTRDGRRFKMVDGGSYDGNKVGLHKASLIQLMHSFVALQVAFERQILKRVFYLIGYRLWL